MDLKSIEFYEFIPKSGDNDKEEDPVTFECTYLTPAEMNKATKQQAVAGMEKEEVQIVINKDELVRRALVRVKNLTFEGKEITTQQQFSAIRHPLVNQWFNELSNEIIRRANEEEEVLKN